MYVEIPIQAFIDNISDDSRYEEVSVDELENMDLKEVKDIDFLDIGKQSDGFKTVSIVTTFNKDVNISKKHPDMFTIDLSCSEEPCSHLTVVHDDKGISNSCPDQITKPE